MYVIQSKFMNNTETRSKDRPTTRGTDQVLWPFTVKTGFCIQPSSLVDGLIASCQEVILAVETRFSGLCRWGEVATRVNVWSLRLDKTVVHSKIRHWSFGVVKQESKARGEHEAGGPNSLPHRAHSQKYIASRGVRLLNVWNNQTCMYKKLRRAAFVSLSEGKPMIL